MPINLDRAEQIGEENKTIKPKRKSETLLKKYSLSAKKLSLNKLKSMIHLQI